MSHKIGVSFLLLHVQSSSSSSFFFFFERGSFNIRISEIFQCHPCLLYSSLQEKFSANTNILYVDLASAELVGSSKNENSLPGMVLNTKKPVVYEDAFGNRHRYILSSNF